MNRKLKVQLIQIRYKVYGLEYVQKYAAGNDNQTNEKDESDVSSIMEYSDTEIDDLDL